MTEMNSSDSTIVSAAIYPPIGIMRVGNSPTEFFIGPEVDNPPPQSESSYYRDATGALKRQAARFRIYGLNAAGEAVCELNADNATIEWQARLANQKASWYEFQLALDIPEAAKIKAPLRNNNVIDRSTLLIDGGRAVVSGRSVCGAQAQKFQGEFEKIAVYLGEMQTDDKGRLLMLGGHGKSANPQGDPAVTFGNNDGWYDDTADGPITATVEFEGSTLKVAPAWIVCAPPDYAPMQKSVRTMWDLMRDVAVTACQLPAPAQPSFTDDILPIFQRMTNLQWVNAGFASGFGWDSPYDFTSEEWLTKLSNPSALWQESRRVLFNNFRSLNVRGEAPSGGTNDWNPEPSSVAPQLWPWLYGDAMSVNASLSPRQFASLTPLQLRFLQQWAEGDFVADYSANATSPASIDELPIAEQPDMLTCAAMDFCLADAFHPGCEMTWPMRTASMYAEAFRLRHAEDTAPTHGTNYGATMTSQIALNENGPIKTGQVAGGITRWMAIPWQTDTASCRDGYNAAYDPYLPTFWPARVPNNMLSEENYAQVTNEALPVEVRQAAFNDRELWLDDLPIGPSDDYMAQINSMIDGFGQLAVVLPQSPVGCAGPFPDTMQVGMTPSPSEELTQLKVTAKAACRDGVRLRPDLSQTDKANCYHEKL